MAIQDVIKWQTVDGEARTAHGYTVIPQSQSLTIRFPLGNFVWNRPIAILVESDVGSRRVPIIDVTRFAQLAIFSIAFLFMLWARRKR